MDAKTFYKKILCNLKGGTTPLRAYNRAKKFGLSDELSEIQYWTGMTSEKACEFGKQKRGMKAKTFYKKILCNLKGVTAPQDVYKLAKKFGLSDDISEIQDWTGMIHEKAVQFKK